MEEESLSYPEQSTLRTVVNQLAGSWGSLFLIIIRKDTGVKKKNTHPKILLL